MSNFLNKSIFYGDVRFNINSKRERSTSPELSDASISSADVKRRLKLKYFMGRGSKEWKPKEELLINNINITEGLKQFRKKSIVEAENGQIINSLRILSLSHIFPLNKFDSQKCISRHFPEDTRAALKLVSSRSQPKFERAPAKAIVYCKNEADGLEDDEISKEEEEEKHDMMKVVKALVKKEKLRKLGLRTYPKHLLPKDI